MPAATEAHDKGLTGQRQDQRPQPLGHSLDRTGIAIISGELLEGKADHHVVEIKISAAEQIFKPEDIVA